MPQRKPMATRYARALVDVALERRIHEKIGAELKDIETMLSSQKDIQDVFDNPAFPSDVRKAILRQILQRLGADRILENFLVLLLERNRIKLLPEIAHNFSELVDEQLGIIAVDVKTATDLPVEERELLRKKLGEVAGQEVKLNYSIDKLLIGGVVLQVGSTVFDGSVKGQLDAMRRRIAGD